MEEEIAITDEYIKENLKQYGENDPWVIDYLIPMMTEDQKKRFLKH